MSLLLGEGYARRGYHGTIDFASTIIPRYSRAMNYAWLFAFVVFAEHLSFTRAARALHISQPALHVQIRKLGEEIGRPLYRRDGKLLSLTPEGKRVAAFGREVQERGRSVLEELRGESRSGPVILASGNGAFQYLLGPAIRKFPKARWPLRLLTMSGPDAIAAVRDAKAHLCVVATDDPPTDLSVVQLRSVGQKVILPASHRLAKRRWLRPADLADESLVVAPTGSPHRAMLTQLLRASGHAPSVAVEASGWDLMLQFARYGLGLAVVNDFCPAPTGTIGIPLRDAPDVTYHLIGRTGFTSRGTDALHALIRETIVARHPSAAGS
jgi:LysR family transcriptional regulator, low CO2-responsive transcriptional regulator